MLMTGELGMYQLNDPGLREEKVLLAVVFDK